MGVRGGCSLEPTKPLEVGFPDTQGAGGGEADLLDQQTGGIHHQGVATDEAVGRQEAEPAPLGEPVVHRQDCGTGQASYRAGVLRVSMPGSLEGFARARVPGARRVELCHREGRAVVREADGAPPIAQGCVPGAGDRVVSLAG